MSYEKLGLTLDNLLHQFIVVLCLKNPPKTSLSVTHRVHFTPTGTDQKTVRKVSIVFLEDWRKRKSVLARTYCRTGCRNTSRNLFFAEESKLANGNV